MKGYSKEWQITKEIGEEVEKSKLNDWFEEMFSFGPK